LQSHRDNSWLDIDHFLDIDLGFEDSAAEDKCQEMGKIEDKLRFDGAKDGRLKTFPKKWTMRLRMGLVTKMG